MLVLVAEEREFYKMNDAIRPSQLIVEHVLKDAFLGHTNMFLIDVIAAILAKEYSDIREGCGQHA